MSAIDIFEFIYYNANNEMENFRKKADKYFFKLFFYKRGN